MYVCMYVCKKDQVCFDHHFIVCPAKWKVGAWGIQGPPLIPTSPQIESAPVAGKFPQPSNQPPFQAPITLMNQLVEGEHRG